MFSKTRKTFQDSLKIYFILQMYIMTQVNYVVTQENIIREKRLLLNNLYAEKYKYTPCPDFQKVYGILCEDGTGEYNITDIVFYKYKKIPEGMLAGYSIQKMILVDPDTTVAENFLQGVVQLYQFRVDESSIKTVPDFRFVKDSIKFLSIDSSHLTSLDGKNLQNLTSLKSISFRNNDIQYIDKDVFKGTENLEYIFLSGNRLTSIPPTLLNDMKQLFMFNAHHNYLNSQIDELFSVTQPKIISLEFNNITNPHFVLRVENDTICKHDLRNPSYGYDIDLSYNSIKEAPDSFFICYANGSNDRAVTLFSSLKLVGNELENFNTSLSYSKIENLDASRNRLQYLTDEDFRFVLVSHLDLHENEIQWIDRNAFYTSRFDLASLDLSDNKISSINGSVQYLSYLLLLNLSHNSIQSFAEDEFTGLKKLTKLYLQHNQIKSLGQLQQLPELVELNIAHNDIKLIKPVQIPKTLEKIYLEGNPFKCDCQLLPLIKWMKGNNFLASDIDLCLRSDFKNNLRNRPNCPDMCSCKCTKYEDVSFMFLDCSSMNLSALPEIRRNNLSKKKNNETITSDDQRLFVIEQNVYPTLHIEDQLLGMNLENNNFESLNEAQIPANLIELYLFNNKFELLSKSITNKQQNLKQMSLSENPWNCDCNTSIINFKTWMTSNKRSVRDIDNVTCGENGREKMSLNGKVIWNLTDLDLCPTAEKLQENSDWIVSVSVASFTSVIFCLVAKILYTKYELHIKVFLYSHGFTFVREEEVDYDKRFDAFISFSHEDDEFVIKQIVSEIESKDPNIRLCLHYRHFKPGEYIHKNIIYAVQNSKRTVFILTKNFAESEWCLLEFQIAHTQAMEDKVHRIILVKLGDLPKDIDSTIKVYMKSTTYLTWEENKFWEKLLFVLSSQTSVSNGEDYKTV